jgi:hypothetical protein
VSKLFNQTEYGIPSHKIMIVGKNVTTVQRVSRYCLKQGIEVLPYYGVPTAEEISLFSPDVLIVCLPVLENFFLQIDQPFILWSEPSINVKLPVASSCIELKTLLQQTLQSA